MPSRKRKKPIQKVTISGLGIQKTEDQKAVLNWRSRGLRFGLGLTAFLRSLFEINESLPAHQKMTNAELERQVLKECGHVEATARSFASRTMTINKYRHKHNKGVLVTPHYIPLPLSFRYDVQGYPVDTRKGRIRLEPKDISETIVKYHEHLYQWVEEDITIEEFLEHMYQVHEDHFNTELPRIDHGDVESV